MKYSLQKSLLWAAVLFLALNTAYTVEPVSAPAGRASVSKGETEAAKALTKLGVPLQKDPEGVVRWIEATYKEMDDNAMRYLPSLPRLEWLEIGGGKVSAKGMEHLKGCRSLKRLYIHDVDLSGDTLSWLSGLPNLQALSLQHTRIDGKVLKNLSSTDSLAVLNLSGNQILDDDMDMIAQLSGLEVLALADTKVTGAGIAKLINMKHLIELNLEDCNILDKDLVSFLSMPSLRIVYAKGCNLNGMAIQNIIIQFPMLAIFNN